MRNKQKVIVIGAGIGGLSIAPLLSREGYDVTVVEKNSIYGGRGRVLKANNFIFDMGPSWYLLPEVFADYFKMFGESIDNYLELTKLEPSYRIFLPEKKQVDITTDMDCNIKLFNSLEEDGGRKFQEYLKKSEKLYKLLVGKLFYQDLTSKKLFLNKSFLNEFKGLFFSDLFSSYEKLCSNYFESEDLKRIIEYGAALVGSHPEDAPALYAMMSYADYKVGVFYPKGGISKLFSAIYKLAKKNEIKFRFNFDVTKIEVINGKATSVISSEGEKVEADIVVSNADYAFTEINLLDKDNQTYGKQYWESKKIGASGFIIFLGIDKRIDNLLHHNLFLDRDWKEHFGQLLKSKDWPEKPAYYVCCPSKTDETVAPAGCENLFFTVPIPAGAEDNPKQRTKYFDAILKHFESVVGTEIKYNIVYKRVFTIKDFEDELHAYKGTALGLANTLRQTGFFRVNYRSKKVKNLYYTGQYVHPGSGLAACIASSRIVAEKIINSNK